MSDYPDFKADEIRSIEADSVIMAVGQERDSQLTQLVGDVTLILRHCSSETRLSSPPATWSMGLRPPYTLWLPDVAAPRSSVSWAGQDMFYGRQYAGPYVDDFTVDTGNAVAILVKRAWATSARVPEISLKRRNI